MNLTQSILHQSSKQFFTLTATALLSGVTFFSGPLLANPEGGVITAGNVTITQSGNQATITQSTDKGIIQWHRHD